ncbi:MAG: Na(+)/H(+) antiporter subunit B [Alphaproteobacteria bacterium]|nr:Na(+)/H(+) antiporter subunit B [Alphaproteobacteria bacterium]
MRLDLILRVGAKLVLPFILLFALYVQFHGDYGPGGGFQAGVIAAGMVILYAIIFGIRAAKQIAPPSIVEFMVPLGVLIYCGTGIVSLLLGYNYLDFTGFHPDFLRAHEWGILIVELGVLVTVSSTMIAMFYAFAQRGRR